MPDVLSNKRKDLVTEALYEAVTMRYSAYAHQKFVFCCKSECLLSVYLLFSGATLNFIRTHSFIVCETIIIFELFCILDDKKTVFYFAKRDEDAFPSHARRIILKI